MAAVAVKMQHNQHTGLFRPLFGSVLILNSNCKRLLTIDVHGSGIMFSFIPISMTHISIPFIQIITVYPHSHFSMSNFPTPVHTSIYCLLIGFVIYVVLAVLRRFELD
jgi:uncharacterized membrane protein